MDDQDNNKKYEYNSEDKNPLQKYQESKNEKRWCSVYNHRFLYFGHSSLHSSTSYTVLLLSEILFQYKTLK